MSPKMYNIPLEEAEEIGRSILGKLQGLYTKAEIAGSVRRQRPIVHDIDIVLIPQLFAFPDRILIKLKERWPNLEILRKGPKIIGVNLYQGVSVDIYASEDRFWGTHLLRWTGSTAHNIRLCNRAISLGLKFAVSRGVQRGSNVIASRTEEAIYEALELDYLAPEDREAP
jgi:DNA polymerase (family 10)